MSDEMANKTMDHVELAFLNALKIRKTIADALKNENGELGLGTLSCLPGADGFADTEPAVILSGTVNGLNQLYLKEHQKQNQFPSAKYVTRDKLEKIKEYYQQFPEDYQDTVSPAYLRICAEEKGVSVNYSELNEKTQEWDIKTATLYNIDQTTRPQALEKWSAQETIPGLEISCTSTEPENYLAQYFAAVSMGGQFKVSPEQAKEFAKNLEKSMYEQTGISHKTGDPISNPFKLSRICNEASVQCKEIVKDLHRQQHAENREQKQERQQSRGGVKR